MIKIDFYMKDNCEISKAMLYKNNDTKNPRPVDTIEEAEKLIKNEKVLYFCTKSIQGSFTTDHIFEYFANEEETV